MRLAKFEVFWSNNLWYWRLKGGNGETMCISEGFTTRYSAKRAAKRARALARFALIKELD